MWSGLGKVVNIIVYRDVSYDGYVERFVGGDNEV